MKCRAKSKTRSFAFVAIAGAAIAAASCGEGLDISPVGGVSAAVDASAHDAGGDARPSGGDAGDAGDGGGPDVVDSGADAGPSYVLVPFALNLSLKTQLVAVNLDTKETNYLDLAGQGGVLVATAAGPYMLEQALDTVKKLDPQAPWNVAAAWDGYSNAPTGGPLSPTPAAPIAMATVGTKAYVPRLGRNDVAVIDTSRTAASAPVSAIDLSAFVQADDSDKTIEPAFAFYVEARHMVYVLLANVDRTKWRFDRSPQFVCASTTPLLVAIDARTDKVVPIPGATGPNGSFALAGYAPVLDPGFADGHATARAAATYDPAGDRLLVVHAGCGDVLPDGGPGAAKRTGIEQLAFDGSGALSTTMLLDLSLGSHRVTDLAYYGPDLSLVVDNGQVYLWDPTSPVIGPSIGTGDLATKDGNGAFVSVDRQNDRGDFTFTVSRTLLADGGGTTWGTGAPIGYAIGNVVVWPVSP